MKKNPVGIKNNRFNLVNSKLILKGEVKSLLKDKFFKEDSVLLKVEEKSSVLGILNKVFKINIILIYILILMFLKSLLNDFKYLNWICKIKVNLLFYKIQEVLKKLCLLRDIKMDSFENFDILLYMTITGFNIKHENDFIEFIGNHIMLYFLKFLKKIDFIWYDKLHEFSTNDYLKRYLLESIVAYIIKNLPIWIIYLCNICYVWNFPNIDKIFLEVSILFLMAILWGIGSYILNLSYFNKLFSIKEMFKSILISLCLLILLSSPCKKVILMYII